MNAHKSSFRLEEQMFIKHFVGNDLLFQELSTNVS